jgi:tight adherence protein B
LTDTATIAAALKAGMSPSEVRKRFEPSPLASKTLELCQSVGAPPVLALERVAEVETSWEVASAELELAASGPKSSAKLVTLLPLVVLLGAQFLGLRVFNSPGPFLLGSLGLGLALLYGGWLWSKRILEKAAVSKSDPGAALDALSATLAAGLPTAQAYREVEARFGQVPTLPELNHLSSQTGLALSKLVLAEADRLRLEVRVSAHKHIRQAGVKLMWPLGLLVLPSFVLLAVIPLSLAMLRAN